MRFDRHAKIKPIRKVHACRDSAGRICGTLAYGRDAEGVLWIRDGGEYVRFRKGGDLEAFNAILRRRAAARTERADRENARLAGEIRRNVAGKAGWDVNAVPAIPVGRLGALVAKGA